MAVKFTIRNFAQRIPNLNCQSLQDTLLSQFIGQHVSIEYMKNSMKKVIFVSVTRDGHIMDSFKNNVVDFSQVEEAAA